MNDWAIQILPREIVDDVIANASDLLRLSVNQKKKYGMPLTEEEAEAERIEKERMDGDADIYRLHRHYEIEHDYQQQFADASDKIGFVVSITEDISLSPIERARRINHCTDWLFKRLYFSFYFDPKFYEDIGWETIYDILEKEEDFLLDDQCNPENIDEHFSWIHWLNRNLVNQIITEAMLGEVERLNMSIEMLDDEMKDEFKGKEEWHWTRLVDLFLLRGSSLLRDTIDCLRCVRRVSLILPYFKKCVEELEVFTKKQSDYEERYMYSLYEYVAECADDAAYDDVCSEEDSRRYRDLEYEYRCKMKNITGATYQLNFNRDVIEP